MSARPHGHVIGPGGNILTVRDLPPKNTRRWVPRRKAEVIAAVNGGLLDLPEACARYAISQEEFSIPGSRLMRAMAFPDFAPDN